MGNKIDTDKREVTVEEAMNFADSEGIPYMEISAYENKNIDILFDTVISNYVRSRKASLK